MSLDFITNAIAIALLMLAVWVVLTTRSAVVRFTLATIVVVIIALMVWNLATHGGYHAV